MGFRQGLLICDSVLVRKPKNRRFFFVGEQPYHLRGLLELFVRCFGLMSTDIGITYFWSEKPRIISGLYKIKRDGGEETAPIVP